MQVANDVVQGCKHIVDQFNIFLYVDATFFAYLTKQADKQQHAGAGTVFALSSSSLLPSIFPILSYNFPKSDSLRTHGSEQISCSIPRPPLRMDQNSHEVLIQHILNVLVKYICLHVKLCLFAYIYPSIFVRIRSETAPLPLRIRSPVLSVSDHYPLRSVSEKKIWLRIRKVYYPIRSDPFTPLVVRWGLT